MSRGIVYFSLGTKHVARLAVSLLSLRKVYSGNICVLNAGGDNGIVERITRDARIGADMRHISIARYRRHSAYVAKASLWRESPYEATLYLDADTIVARNPSQLLDWCSADDMPGFVVTRFAQWTTQGSIVSGRIRQWESVDPQLVAKSLDAPHAAINTGVVAWSRQKAGAVLRAWEQLSREGWRCSFTDELAAQLLIRQYKHTLVADMYNCSPIYGQCKDNAVIWHMHGGKSTRPEALPIFLPWLRETARLNVGGFREWAVETDQRLAGLV